MLYLLSAILIIFLSILSIIHLYWAAGGKKGLLMIQPENKQGKKIAAPSRLILLSIAILLLLMIIITYLRVYPGRHTLPEWLSQNGMLLIAGIFLLRTIGDFRYVGFFKQIRHSAFAEMDSRYYTPIAIFLAVMALIVEVL